MRYELCALQKVIFTARNIFFFATNTSDFVKRKEAPGIGRPI